MTLSGILHMIDWWKGDMPIQRVATCSWKSYVHWHQIQSYVIGLGHRIDLQGDHSDPPKMENLTGAASHGRKVRIGSVWALEASIVQYCQNWCHILVPVGSTTKDLYTKVFNHVESCNLYKRGTSLMSTIRKLEFLGLLWAGCSFLYFISKNSKFKDIEWE